MTTKATLYLDTDLYRTFKMRAVETDQSVSGLVNDALKAQLAEDLEDITTIRKRLDEEGKPLSYEAALDELRSDGKI